MTAVAKNASTPIDELKRRIGAEQRALDALQAQAAELQTERQSALLADGDEPLEAAETAIIANLRQAERHRARLDAYLAELEEAEAAEREAQAIADYRRAAAELKQAEKLLLVDYPRLSAELAALLARVQAADQLAERMNAELPPGCERLRPPSHARHESMTPDRTEVRRFQRWVDQAGRNLGAVQLIDGEPSVPGARLVAVEEETVIPGRKPWWPSPLHTEVRLPRLHRDGEDYWMP